MNSHVSSTAKCLHGGLNHIANTYIYIETFARTRTHNIYVYIYIYLTHTRTHMYIYIYKQMKAKVQNLLRKNFLEKERERVDHAVAKIKYNLESNPSPGEVQV